MATDNPECIESASPRSVARRLPLEFGLLIVFAAVAAVLTSTVLEIQAGATAYIVGESHWSKGQQDAVRELYQYAEHGQNEDLVLAREALAVPLGDLRARLALDLDPPDLAAAREGFLQGGNAPQEVPRLIRMYRYFRHAPYFRDSVRLWREADDHILQLAALTDEMERRISAGPITTAEGNAFQERVIVLDERMRPLELAFSASLVHGARALNAVLIASSVALFAVIAWLALRILRSTLRRIAESEGIYRAAFHQATVGMLKMDRQGRFIEVNDAIGRILGWPAAALRGKCLDDIAHPEELEALRADLVTPAGDRHAPPTDHRFVHRDGGTRLLRWSTSHVQVAGGREPRVFALAEDVSEARELAGEMAWQASHDALTGLINRREIERRLERATASARANGTNHTLCFIDLDQFKIVNDTCGHAAGDQLLRELAALLQSHLRASDWVGRLGGDEFALLFERTAIDEAERVAERLGRAMADAAFVWEGRNFGVTGSIGLVEIDGRTRDVGDLLRAADRACYVAKDQGRNCIRTYRDTDEAISRRRDAMAWVGGIRKAVQDRQILLYAQRIQTLGAPDTLGYEILLRLRDDAGRLYMPGEFLPAAETYGEIVALDRLVVATTLERLAESPQHLARLGLCHVNVSAQSIVQPAFRAHVSALLERFPAVARKLCFEITETAVIADLVQARAFIDDVRAHGCSVALDDFGSGMSSFAYLKNLPVDILKIDGAFIRDLARNDVDPVLVRSMCEIARCLKLRTVAESVESSRVLASLRELGVDAVQGFAIHTAVPLDDLIAESVVEPAVQEGPHAEFAFAVRPAFA
ncbi:putative bifunctional diguanylate cyclase/phosphodiesterase [Dokdonella sp. MW10]|uniref:putative bifunctional diguanylate cyclase/phosphodiesterase n=1 Tax=Dokdonella sp. MW10 TaxID=2992926 RepID=UPI003F81FB28